MKNIKSTVNNLRFLDDLAVKNTPIHNLHPVIKLLTSVVYIGVTISFSKYDIFNMLPLVFYPLLIFSLAELPKAYFFKNLLIAIPFIVLIGIANPLIDRQTWLVVGKVHISGGWISFITIIFKFALTFLAALQLVATSGLNEIGAALLKCKAPRVFVTQLLLVYRYLIVLIEETGRILQAHSLRSLTNSGLGRRVWGSLVGQLLLRTLDRAGRIYQAMLCRGFSGELMYLRKYNCGFFDILYLFGWSGFFLMTRYISFPELLGKIILGAGR